MNFLNLLEASAGKSIIPDLSVPILHLEHPWPLPSTWTAGELGTGRHNHSKYPCSLPVQPSFFWDNLHVPAGQSQAGTNGLSPCPNFTPAPVCRGFGCSSGTQDPGRGTKRLRASWDWWALSRGTLLHYLVPPKNHTCPAQGKFLPCQKWN